MRMGKMTGCCVNCLQKRSIVIKNNKIENISCWKCGSRMFEFLGNGKRNKWAERSNRKIIDSLFSKKNSSEQESGK